VRIEITMLADRDGDGRQILAGKDLQVLIDPEELIWLDLRVTLCGMLDALLREAKARLEPSSALDRAK